MIIGTNHALHKIVTISILIIAFFAFQDVTGAHFFGLLGGFGSEAYLKVEPLYLQQFWAFSYVLIGVMAVVYFILVRDISESLLIFIIPSIMLLSGLEDLFFYLFSWLPLPSSMPWLYGNYNIMGNVSKLMGLSTVTPLSITVSMCVGVLLCIGIYKLLIKLN